MHWQQHGDNHFLYDRLANPYMASVVRYSYGGYLAKFRGKTLGDFATPIQGKQAIEAELRKDFEEIQNYFWMQESDREGDRRFALQALGGGFFVNTVGRLQKAPCDPMRFSSWESAKLWASSSGIRTPLIPTDMQGSGTRKAEVNQSIDAAVHAYRFNLEPQSDDRCDRCKNRDSSDGEHRCELLEIVIAQPRRSRCPLFQDAGILF